ncbi:hypothetical protein Q5424_08400 [Conexibacter sp. JD483]|uniref:hypothetical protein n=1 Tax=unclassified Conexibacter TaxID=2627773 RepID=UPI0027190A4B|nr:MULTISPECIES: hypothetical protein [unclassified Conexibacter]MDO8183941.1 hypothetical protein [Conexibacter sp. CPCC 205706]MDO8196933.1 hypothetical protein [Conexibacter sp. CPCC 205762]MDR9369097.1 hypothetical protein [Conexibacter sp. JD483]
MANHLHDYALGDVWRGLLHAERAPTPSHETPDRDLPLHLQVLRNIRRTREAELERRRALIDAVARRVPRRFG